VIVTKQNVGVAGFLSVAYAYRWLFLIALIFLCATYFIYWFIVAKRRKKKEENKK